MRAPEKFADDHAMPSRRDLIVTLAAAAGMFPLASALVQARQDDVSHSAESIHQEVHFQASRARVYDTLTTASQFEKVMRAGATMQSGAALGSAPTAISGQPGGAFTIFAGHIVGRQIELVRNERLVQAWRVATWNPGQFSIARFELVAEGSGTKLVFDHTGFPKGEADHLAAGWKGNYWEPMTKVLAG